MRSIHQGFTLVELMITLIVFAIVVTVAIPNLQYYTLQNRVKTGAQNLFSSLIYARSEAVKRDAPVYLNPADADAWEKGWVVTTVAGRTYSECQDGESDCLRIREPLAELAIATAAADVEYGGNGRVATEAEFRFCPADANAAVQQRVVTADLSGRPRIEYEGDC